MLISSALAPSNIDAKLQNESNSSLIQRISFEDMAFDSNKREQYFKQLYLEMPKDIQKYITEIIYDPDFSKSREVYVHKFLEYNYNYHDAQVFADQKIAYDKEHDAKIWMLASEYDDGKNIPQTICINDRFLEDMKNENDLKSTLYFHEGTHARQRYEGLRVGKFFFGKDNTCITYVNSGAARKEVFTQIREVEAYYIQYMMIQNGTSKVSFSFNSEVLTRCNSYYKGLKRVIPTSKLESDIIKEALKQWRLKR